MRIFQEYKRSRFHKTFLFLLFILLLVLIPSKSLFADGAFIFNDPETNLWNLQKMNQQLCAINYENGRENMLLSIHFNDLQGEKAVWIFPVPAVPDQIKVDMLKDFPSFNGNNIEEEMKEDVASTFRIMALWEIFPAPFILDPWIKRGLRGALYDGASLLNIHQHVEEFGATTELITAKQVEDISGYLREKDLQLPENVEHILNTYIGQDYSFAVTWISDLERFSQETMAKTYSGFGEKFNKLSVFLSFPSKEIYFPMKMTSVYEDQRIPMMVYVSGYVRPRIYQEVKGDVTTSYLLDKDFSFPQELGSFFNGRKSLKKFKYTEIKIDTYSKNLKEDLWMENKSPVKIILAQLVADHIVLLGVLGFLLISGLSSLLASIIIFKGREPLKLKFFYLGFLNVLTIVGFSIACRQLRIDSRYTNLTESFPAPRTLGETTKNLFLVCLIPTLFIYGLMLFFEIKHFDLVDLAIPSYFYMLILFFLAPFYYIFSNNRIVRNYLLVFYLFFSSGIIFIPQIFFLIYKI